jgi:hypothetical protein
MGYTKHFLESTIIIQSIMKNTKLIAFLFLLTGVVFFSSCGSSSSGTVTPVGVEGTWKITTITPPSGGVTPASWTPYVGGTISFTATTYTSKKADGTDGESGTYTYTDSKVNLAGSGTVTPGTYNATLSGNSLTWLRNLANTGKPEQIYIFALSRQ